MPIRSACTTMLFAAALLPLTILGPASAAPSALRTAKSTVGKGGVVEARNRGRSVDARRGRSASAHRGGGGRWKVDSWSERETGIYQLGNGWIGAFGAGIGQGFGLRRGNVYGNGGP